MSIFLPDCDKKCFSISSLLPKVDHLRKEGKLLVTMNGAFDILHAGHLHFIAEAAEQGDVLIIALNTDASIKKSKGPLRPLIPLKYRMALIAALQWVDYVTFFDDSDPCRLLDLIRPDVHVNGSEYGKDCVETKILSLYGGRLHLIDKVAGLSTSQIIKKVKQGCAL